MHHFLFYPPYLDAGNSLFHNTLPGVMMKNSPGPFGSFPDHNILQCCLIRRENHPNGSKKIHPSNIRMLARKSGEPPPRFKEISPLMLVNFIRG